MGQLIPTEILDEVVAVVLDGIHVGAVPYGEGHINNTYCEYRQLEDGRAKRYILQRINTEAVMSMVNGKYPRCLIGL